MLTGLLGTIHLQELKYQIVVVGDFTRSRNLLVFILLLKLHELQEEYDLDEFITAHYPINI
ncbi:hypothetical protein C1N27_14750 [Vibrio diazotrophicus]|nr:hypothetical protein C1N27_14750 [Vibrio diazotrophicus]